ncbi:MAG: flippase-like domain-containing protein [Chitinispirillaceae bacterium]|nr:flippase-like domain-containing protein [Chitinispirillaceae bacterium]
MHRKRLIFTLKLVVSFGAIAIIFTQIDFGSFITALSSAHVPLLGICFLLMFALPAINACKIKLLLPGSAIGFRYILFTNFTALFLRLTVPTDLGAELGRGYYFSKKTGSPTTAFSAIVLDRYFGLLSQVTVLAVAAMAFGMNAAAGAWIRLGILTAAAALLLALFLAGVSLLPAVKRSKRKGMVGITSLLSRFSEYAHRLRSMPLRVAAVVVISLAYHCLTLLTIICTSAAYNVHLGFHEAAAISLSSTVAFVVPISVAGLGIIEGIYAGLFALFSLQKEIGIAVSLTMRVITLLLVIPGILFFIYGERMMKKSGE